MTEKINIPRLVIAASSSSAGKTMITAGLARCLVKRGFKVQTFKVGPDFIDPQYLALASRRPCVNLDSWLMREEDVLRDFAHYAHDADIALIEGVRSLYDSADPLSLKGSTWLVADIIKSPIILIIDISGINIGAAAIAKGFSTLMEGVEIKGVILNKARGKGHVVKAKSAVESMAKLRVVGVLPRLEELEVEMRHLGLMPAMEKRVKAEEAIERWSNIIDENVNVDYVIEIAKTAPPLSIEMSNPSYEACNHHSIKVAIALDEAFNFYYKQNIDMLRRLGADIVTFSPLMDNSLEEISGLIIGGGYPQLFLAQLQENTLMISCLKKLIEDECPTYAECGGLMYLCEEIIDFSGFKARGVAIIPATCRISRSTRSLGYTIHRVIHDNVLSRSGDSVKGHEFHYSSIELRSDVNYAYEVLRGYGIDGRHDGIIVHNTLASYTHILASSQENLFRRFIESCLHYSKH